MFAVAYQRTEQGALGRRRPPEPKQTGRREALIRMAQEWERKRQEQKAEQEEQARRRSELRQQMVERMQNRIPQPSARPFVEARTLVARVAAWHGFTYDDLVGPKRERIRLVPARFDAIAAVKQNYPSISSLHLGRMFNRDHASILNALRQRGMR